MAQLGARLNGIQKVRGSNPLGSTSVLSSTSPSRRLWFKEIAAVTALGAGAGLCIGALAFVTARYGPAGSNWSFRGNGALGVYTAVPALLAAGWTAVILRNRVQGRWLRASVAAGLVGLVLAIVDALLLPTFGSHADQAVGRFLLLALTAWMFLAPMLALTIPARSQAPLRMSASRTGVEAMAVVVGLAIGLGAAAFAIPAGS